MPVIRPPLPCARRSSCVASHWRRSASRRTRYVSESLCVDGVSREQSISNAFFPQVGAVRLATEDCALPGNRTVKKGETVALSHIAFSRDEALWGPDAAKFSTAREAYAGTVAFDSRGTADDISYSAFSQGTHKCPGERVALVIVQTTLALLVARGVRPVKVPPLCFERATLAQRAAPVRAIVGVV